MGVKEKNQEKILKMLRCHGSLSVDSVRKALALSEASVRRYFSEMEHAGKVCRYHGGIRPADSKGYSEYQFNEAAANFTAEKHLIGVAAAQQIRDHDRLFFDSGTTALECGNALAERVGAKELSDLRIVTNSLPFGPGLAPHVPVVLTGGVMRLERMDLCGNVTLETVRRYNFTKAFLGTDGISESGVLSTTDEETAALAAAVIEQSREVFILADSSKLGKSSFVPYGSLKNPRMTLITDFTASPVLLTEFEKSGIRLLVARVVSNAAKFSGENYDKKS